MCVCDRIHFEYGMIQVFRLTKGTINRTKLFGIAEQAYNAPKVSGLMEWRRRPLMADNDDDDDESVRLTLLRLKRDNHGQSDLNVSYISDHCWMKRVDHNVTLHEVWYLSRTDGKRIHLNGCSIRLADSHLECNPIDDVSSSLNDDDHHHLLYHQH